MVYHKPLSGIYRDNYRYGTSMYSPGLSDVEKNYRNTLSKTHVRSDRGDLGLYSFAGSNVHGGVPAAERPSAPKGIRSSGGSGSADLYAPVNTSDYRPKTPNSDIYAPLHAADYGPGYYDHLRARSPERRARGPPPYYALDDPAYKTVPTKLSTDVDYDFDSGKKTTTKTTTTTTERWVPLTTHIYHTPYHSYFYKSTPFSSYTYRTTDDMYNYNFVDDYKRYSSTTKTTRSKNIDALDLSVTSKSTTDYSHHMDKCSQIQKQLDEVNKLVYEAEMKVKNDIVNSRSQLQSELAEITMVVDDASKYNDDLYRVIKKQAKQISSLNSKYDDIGRHLVDVSDTLEKSRLRCLQIQSDLSAVQSGVELSMKRRY